jgi:hypothetical protein
MSGLVPFLRLRLLWMLVNANNHVGEDDARIESVARTL